MKKTITFLALIAFAVCTFRCTKGDIIPYYKDLTISAKYANPVGGSPSLEIDNTSVSAPVKFNTNQLPIATTSNGRVFLTLPNVRFQDELGVYDVYNVVTEEFRNGKWEADAENFLKVTRTKKLQYVLVLDMSSSLGSDISNVKSIICTY